jgi:hypothetical protein
MVFVFLSEELSLWISDYCLMMHLCINGDRIHALCIDSV